jgi:hypothetical protein
LIIIKLEEKMNFLKKIKVLSGVIIIAAVFALSFLPTAMIYGKSNQDSKFINGNLSENFASKDKSPVVTTNKLDYSPDEKVVILGKNFEPNKDYKIVVIRPPDGLIVTGDGTFTPGSDTVTTNNGGNFNYHYTLCGEDGEFIVNVIGADEEIIASTSFTDATVRW